jgi:molybdopterin-guanine dinucleotide biosynthesis protein A
VRLVGFALAGGRSERMGQDKALLPWGESDLLGHTVARLRAVTGDVRILCGPEPRYGDRGVRVVPDGIPDAGPIAGLLAGLESAGDRPGLFLAVDLPLVPVGLLSHLAALAAGFDAVVPVLPRGEEPLCAVYGPGCLEPVRRRVSGGERKMTSFWPDVRVLEVGLEELARFGDAEALFCNLNAPSDYSELTLPRG